MFKEANKSDAKVFYDLYDELRGFVEKGSNKPTFDEYKKLFCILLDEKGYRFWKIVDEDDIVIGVISVNERFNLFHCKKIIYIDEIVITAKFRNKGYGRKAIDFICDFYERIGGVAKVELSTDYNNSPAREFYNKVGFDDYAALYKIKI